MSDNRDIIFSKNIKNDISIINNNLNGLKKNDDFK